jgi:hypothetical protein
MEENAFYGSALCGIDIPSSVEVLGDSAFNAANHFSL